MQNERKILVLVILVLGAVVGRAQFSERTVEIPSNGWVLVGDLKIPRSKQPVPVVLMLNKANGTRRSYEAMAEQLADRGIASLRLDLRGHGESTNKGKFGPPFDAPMQALVDGSDQDVLAAIAFVRTAKGIDQARIGVIGASYSGEEMAVAARRSGYAKAYVALSPGSFSEESIKAIDTSGSSWLFVRSADERHLKGLHEDIRKISKLAQLFEVAGDKHATEMLASTPLLNEMIAVWFKHNLK